MIVDVVMPKMGESINEGTILEWRKEVGEKINLDEILLEIGTDKVDSEIPSSAAGTVIEILAEPNDVKEVGQVIARIDTGSSVGKVRNEPSPVNEDPLEKKVKISASQPRLDYQSESQKSALPDRKVFYTPVVMKIAAENEVPFSEIEQIVGTGRSGRVTKKDIFTERKRSMEKIGFEKKSSYLPVVKVRSISVIEICVLKLVKTITINGAAIAKITNIRAGLKRV